MRPDRLATLYAVRPWKRLFSPSQPRLPILMYHAIANDWGARNRYLEVNTTPARLEEHLAWLRDHGYAILSLRDGIAALRRETPGLKAVALTFDDGFQDFYTHAYPLLQRYGGSATVYVIAEQTRSTRSQFKGRNCLTEQEVRELSHFGIEIGSHTVNHPELYRLPQGEVERELGESKLRIEEVIGCPISSFAYPYAFPESDRPFVAMVRNFLAEQGYANSVCTAIGTVSSGNDLHFLPRLPINLWDDPALFRAKVEGAYNWLRLPQRAKKHMKGLLTRRRG